MKPVLVLVLLAACLAIVSGPAQAQICVPIWNEFDECHPEGGGEPPSWCGETGARGWFLEQLEACKAKLAELVDLLD